jgi:hypothetical protein
VHRAAAAEQLRADVEVLDEALDLEDVSSARGQRGAKAQYWSGSDREGTRPGISCSRSVPRRGMAPRRPIV